MENDKKSRQTPKRVRKIQAAWTHDMTTRLIKLVKSREALWNFFCRTYKDRNAKETAWAEISKKLGLPRAEVTAKWNSLRGSFRATHIKLAKTKDGESASCAEVIIGRNPHYEALQFLEPTMDTTTHTESNFTELAETEYTSTEEPEIEIPMPKKSCNDEDSDDVLEDVLEEMRDSINSIDSWDAVGNLVATSGRELARTYPQLASEFKSAVIKLVAQFEEKSWWHEY